MQLYGTTYRKASEINALLLYVRRRRAPPRPASLVPSRARMRRRSSSASSLAALSSSNRRRFSSFMSTGLRRNDGQMDGHMDGHSGDCITWSDVPSQGTTDARECYGNQRIAYQAIVDGRSMHASSHRLLPPASKCVIATLAQCSKTMHP